MKRDLSRLFRPKSIAIVGGRAEAGFVKENCQKLGFKGSVWHVHPKRGGFAHLDDLPHAPDAAFVCVNREATIGVVRDLAKMGAGGAVAYAAGFAEAAAELADAQTMQAELLEAAGDMPLIGPNCYGFLNFVDGAGLWPDQQGAQRCETGVAILTQSSNIAINLTMQRRGLPLAYAVTAGNQAQLGLSELGANLLSDTRVTALGIHIEGVGDLRAFEALAETARSIGKHIVVLKAGKSQQAKAAAVSHTASLSGSSAGASALFRRLGMAEVSSLTAMIETLKLLHVSGSLKSNHIASMSCSGGEASLMADAVVGRDIIYPDLEPKQITGLRQALGPKVALSNPLDYNTYIWNNVPAMKATFSAMMQSELGLGIVVADFPRGDRCSQTDWEPVIQATKTAAEITGQSMAILSSLPENMPEDVATRLVAMGIAPLCGIEEAMIAIEKAAWLHHERATFAPILCPEAPKSPRVLIEAEGKMALIKFGVKCPKSVRGTALDVIDGSASVSFPCVLKGEGIAHKTEVGAVALNINSASELYETASKMPADSFLLEEMIKGAVTELLIGVLRDEAHGFVLTLAAGGTLTEVLKDSASLLLPTDETEIRAALQTLRIAPVLNGHRGKPGANIKAIVNVVLAVQDYVIAHQGRLEEVEINPLMVTPTNAVAADVLIRCDDA